MFGACPYLLLVRGRLGTITGTVTGLKFDAGQGEWMSEEGRYCRSIRISNKKEL
jgi:hypothetical protein